jgi:hypothetical protein
LAARVAWPPDPAPPLTLPLRRLNRSAARATNKANPAGNRAALEQGPRGVSCSRLSAGSIPTGIAAHRQHRCKHRKAAPEHCDSVAREYGCGKGRRNQLQL